MHLQESSEQLEAFETNLLRHAQAVVLASELRWYCKVLKCCDCQTQLSASHPDIQWLNMPLRRC